MVSENSVSSCPLLDAKCVEAMANEVWPLDDLSSDEARDDLRRDVCRGLAAAVAALDRDELVRIAEEAVLASARKRGYGGNYLEAWPLRNDACAVLTALGLLPAEHREETG